MRESCTEEKRGAEKRGRIWKSEKEEGSRLKIFRQRKGERCRGKEEDRGEAKDEDVRKKSETWGKPAVPNLILSL